MSIRRLSLNPNGKALRILARCEYHSMYDIVARNARGSLLNLGKPFQQAETGP